MEFFLNACTWSCKLIRLCCMSYTLTQYVTSACAPQVLMCASMSIDVRNKLSPSGPPLKGAGGLDNLHKELVLLMQEPRGLTCDERALRASRSSRGVGGIRHTALPAEIPFLAPLYCQLAVRPARIYIGFTPT